MNKEKQAACCQEKFKTLIGGQALIEGIMMRGPEKQSIAVRSKDGIVTKVEDLKLTKKKNPILGWPLIRGVVNFGGAMVSGVKALMYSADFFPDEEGEDEKQSKLDKWVEEKMNTEKGQKVVVGFSAALGICFSILLFIMLPAVIVELLSPWLTGHVVRNLLEGVIRIGIFVGYMFGVSRLKDMRRVFSYHGAEHKSIRCYEAKLPLTVENVRQQTRFHPRCGTSFLFVVMIISILVFSVVRMDNPYLRVLMRLVLLPVVVAISYEINRFVGRHDNWFTRALVAPGLWFQNFTTFEPDDPMIEVAITALKLVIPQQEGEDVW